MAAFSGLLLAAHAVAFQTQSTKTQLTSRHLFGRGKKGDDSKYEALSADVAAYEALAEPLVSIGESTGRGRGVFATADIAAGATITEYVGLLAATPESHSDDLELYQSYYGNEWRKYSQRYEIGLSGTKVNDAGGVAKGGSVAQNTANEKQTCDVDEGLIKCIQRAGEGEFLLLGKVKDADGTIA